MNLKRYGQIVLAALLTGAAFAQTPPLVDPARMHAQADRLYSAVSLAVQASGGDLERQHLHLVFAFSTGNFATDPVRAEAARQIASDVAAQRLVSGDRLSGYAWELQLWTHGGRSLNPVTVGPDRSAMRASFQDLWPRSPQAGTVGGHDTEAVITELTGELSAERDAVIVLLANTAASQAGTDGRKTVAEDSPAYQAALTGWTRVRTSTTTGASVQLSVSPTQTLDAVIVVPKRYGGAALSGSRTSLVTEQVKAAEASERTGLPWWLWVLGSLVAGVAALLVRRRSQRPDVDSGAGSRSSGQAPRAQKGGTRWALQVGDRVFPVDDVKPGEVLCVLCGPGYPVGTAAGRSVLLAPPELPPLKLLTVTRGPHGLKLTPESGAALGSALPDLLPFRSAEYRVRLSGRASRQNLPPKPYQADLSLSLNPVEATP